jgi:DNA processing protein
MNNTLKWIWALLVFGAGSRHISEIIYNYDSIEEAYEKLSDSGTLDNEMKQKKLAFSQTIRRKLCTTPINQCEMILNYCREKNIGVISYNDECYPQSLKNLDCPPAVLFYRGNKEILSEDLMVSVVGTRKPSQYSLNVANVICTDLAKDGFCIVSGFANGLDTASHMGAINGKGKTIAVVGCGIDVEYPKGSNQRKNAIIESGGLIISEYLPGTTPRPANFPVRNRIIAALGLGTLIIQAPEKSGSLITATLALEMGKDVFCIPPHDIFDKSYAGVVKYLQDGAIPVFSHLDIVNTYYFSYAYSISANHIFPKPENVSNTEFSSVLENSSKTEIEEKTDENNTDKHDNKKIKSEEKSENISENTEIKHKKEEKAVENFQSDNQTANKIYKILSESDEPLNFDAIVEKTNEDIADVMVSLTELEIMQKVSQLQGKLYKLK